MTRSSDQVIRDLEAQLTVQRTATRVYQTALASAYRNLTLLGREDIVKSIQRESPGLTRDSLIAEAKAATPAPQPQAETEDDDCLY